MLFLFYHPIKIRKSHAKKNVCKSLNETYVTHDVVEIIVIFISFKKINWSM